MIDALLVGTLDALQQTQNIPDTALGIRPGKSGKPYAAYKGGGWYYGLYFDGCHNGPSQDGMSLELVYSVGIDITRVLPQIPTAKRGEWLTHRDELYCRGMSIYQMMLRFDSVLATYCNTALESRYNIPAGAGIAFYEDFSTGSMDG